MFPILLWTLKNPGIFILYKRKSNERRKVVDSSLPEIMHGIHKRLFAFGKE